MVHESQVVYMHLFSISQEDAQQNRKEHAASARLSKPEAEALYLHLATLHGSGDPYIKNAAGKLQNILKIAGSGEGVVRGTWPPS